MSHLLLFIQRPTQSIMVTFMTYKPRTAVALLQKSAKHGIYKNTLMVSYSVLFIKQKGL